MPINKVKGGWKIVNVPTIHKTKKDAERQLRAIEAHKAQVRGKGKRKR